MNVMQAIASCFSKYASASGRAARSEFWYWMLFATLVGIAAHLLDWSISKSDQGLFSIITGLALFLPGIAVSIRRLHDIGRSGYWYLISLTIIGILLLIYWACVPGPAGENEYGDDPLAPDGLRPQGRL